MKRLIGLVLLLTALGWSQGKRVILHNIQPEYTTVTLDSTTTSTVYYIFPPPKGQNSGDRTAISTTLPTSASAQAKNLDFSASGALSISMVTDSVTAEESDSLYAYFSALTYDSGKSTWYVSRTDSMYIVFDTPNSEVQTGITYLNWEHGSSYIVDLTGSIKPAAGVAVTFGQVTTDNAGADTKLWVGFWWER